MMTSCQDIRAGLDDLLDDLADADLRAEIEAHLATCPACVRHFESHRRIAGDLRMLGRLADRIVAAEPAPAASPRSRPRRARWPAVAAALILIGTSAYFALSRSSRAPRVVADAERPPTPPKASSVPGAGFRITVPEHVMAVPIESSNPKVHIVWLYNEIISEPPAAENPAPDTVSSPD
jgi:anti-sigma factor RsiW